MKYLVSSTFSLFGFILSTVLSLGSFWLYTNGKLNNLQCLSYTVGSFFILGVSNIFSFIFYRAINEADKRDS